MDAVRRNERIAAEQTFAKGASTDDRLDLYAALSKLPKRQRESVILRYLGDLSEAQTADVMGVSVGSVKTHSSRGVAALREALAR